MTRPAINRKSRIWPQRCRIESLESRHLLAADLLALLPADDSIYVGADENLVLTFDANVTRGAGSITIKNSDDDSVVESIDVSDADKVAIDGSVVTLNPANDLAPDTSYYVQADR